MSFEGILYLGFAVVLLMISMFSVLKHFHMSKRKMLGVKLKRSK